MNRDWGIYGSCRTRSVKSLCITKSVADLRPRDLDHPLNFALYIMKYSLRCKNPRKRMHPINGRFENNIVVVGGDGSGGDLLTNLPNVPVEDVVMGWGFP